MMGDVDGLGRGQPALRPQAIVKPQRRAAFGAKIALAGRFFTMAIVIGNLGHLTGRDSAARATVTRSGRP